MLTVAGRGARFVARRSGTPPPTFGESLRIMRWSKAGERYGKRWPFVVGMLACRTAIDAELNGQRLARLAEMAGETVFDAICAADIGAPGHSLDEDLTPERAAAIGATAIVRALRERRGVDARLLDTAAALLQATGADAP